MATQNDLAEILSYIVEFEDIWNEMKFDEEKKKALRLRIQKNCDEIYLQELHDLMEERDRWRNLKEDAVEQVGDASPNLQIAHAEEEASQEERKLKVSEFKLPTLNEWRRGSFWEYLWEDVEEDNRCEEPLANEDRGEISGLKEERLSVPEAQSKDLMESSADLISASQSPVKGTLQIEGDAQMKEKM